MSGEPVGRSASTPLSFDHLRRLSDDTGLLEHALGRVPRRREGYTTDDNARALWLVTEWLSLRREAGLSRADVRLLGELADIYLAFLLWNLEEDGWWHNNVAYDRTPEPEERSHDCQGRALWACADAWIRLPTKGRFTAYSMLQRALSTLDDVASLRGQAYALATCARLLEAGGAGALALPASWEAPLRRHLAALEQSLLDAYRREAVAGWCWFEPVMTYGNGLLPWALLRAHRVTRNPASLEAGLRSLLFLQRTMTAPEGWLRPVGNASWATRDSLSRWDQQPLELFKLALALDEAIFALRRLDKGGKGSLDEAGAWDGPDGSGGPGRTDGLERLDDPDGPARGDGLAQAESRDGYGDRYAGAIGAAGAPAGALPFGGTAGLSGADGGAGVPNGGTTFPSDRLLPAEPALARSVRRRALASPAAPAEFRPLHATLADLRKAKWRCLQWFHGLNDLGVPMADPWDGSCCDGLQPDGPNRNCGAEATLSYLMTRALCLKDERSRELGDRPPERPHDRSCERSPIGR